MTLVLKGKTEITSCLIEYIDYRFCLLNGILLPKLFWPTVRKYCSSDREKLFKFETEGQEFANFFKQWKFRTIFGNRMSSLTYPGGFSYLIN